MSKRGAEDQGGDERYGAYSGAGQPTMAEKPTQATAAQLARRRIISARKPSGSNRSSRAGTPTGNPFASAQPQQQSMPSFQTTQGTNFGGDFNFTAGGVSNPFEQQQQSSTPPPNAFQFGATPSQPPTQQNGGSGMFGNNSSFGSNFGSNNAQPQQNGFNPSTSSIFGQQNDASKSTSNGFSFGRSNGTQSQQNGATPSTNASFPTFGGPPPSDNPFKSFGQSQEPSQQTQSTPSTSFGGFGQSSQQQNHDKAAATPFFGGFGQNNDAQPKTNGTTSLFGSEPAPPTTSSIFKSFGQQQSGDKPSFGATSQSSETPKANAFSLFSSQPKTATSTLFGATPPPEQTPKATGDSVLGGLDAARASTVKPGMFTSGQIETPKPSESFSFGQPKASTADRQTPRPSSLFANNGETPKTNGMSSLFGGADGLQEQTPKPSGGFTFGQPLQQSGTTPAFKFGQTQAEDTSMTTPGNTPLKQNPFSSSISQPPTTAGLINGPSGTPAAPGKSLFDRISKDPQSTAEKPSFTPSTTFSFGATGANGATGQSTAPSAASKNLFNAAPQVPPATTQEATSDLFSKASGQQTSTTSTTPWSAQGPAPVAPQTKITPPTPRPQRTSEQSSSTNSSKGESKTIGQLNEGLRNHLASQDPAADWSVIMKFYLQKAAELLNKPQSSFESSSARAQAPTAASSSNMSASAPVKAPSANNFGSSTPKAPAISTSNKSFPEPPQQTPKPSSALQKTFSQPPATAPVNKKRSAPFEEDDEDVDKQPATEKRARQAEPIDYPKLPDNASATAKLFQAAFDKSTSGADAPAAEPQASSGGFKPTSSTPAATSGMPSFGGSATGAGGFLAAFGKKAATEEEKARKKRKAEDYDSDEETEEQWEKRDREEQEAKRKKIEEAAKGGSGFVLPGTTQPETPAASSKSMFKQASKEPPATAPSKPSLFAPAASAERGSMFGSKTPGPPSSSNIFDAINGDQTSKSTNKDSGDRTWKPSTPLKFGGTSIATESTTPAAPPPKFGNLFGSNPTPNTSNSSGLLNVPGSKPSIGFNFGAQPASLTASRATTPGVTTDGEGASTAGEGDEEDAAPAEPQAEDMTALLDEEKEKEDVLFSVEMSKAAKLEEKKNADTGEVANGWNEKGKGPLYVLKNKDTGKVRVLLKIKPLGKAAMNFAVLPKVKFVLKGKRIQGPFVDHMAYINADRPSSWFIQVGKEEDARKLEEVLNEAAQAG